ncbi:MAG: energy transducer TonB [Acidobacteriota bacterium]
MRIGCLLPLVLLSFAALAPPVLPQGGDSNINAIESALESRSPLRALRLARRALERLTQRVSDDPEGAAQIARLLALQAVAEAGIDDLDSARWSWALALHLDPEVQDLNLLRFGPTGTLVASWEERPLAVDGEITDERFAERPGGPATLFSVDGDSILPDRKSGKDPRYGRGSSPRPVILQIHLDRRGRPTLPRVVEAPSPLRAYLATEAVRDWRFQPARINGNEVAVYINWRVDFR